jgi:hypothetical protein
MKSIQNNCGYLKLSPLKRSREKDGITLNHSQKNAETLPHTIYLYLTYIKNLYLGRFFCGYVNKT